MDKELLKQYKETFSFGVSVSYDKILKRGIRDKKIPHQTFQYKCEKVWREKNVRYRVGVIVGWKWLSNGIAAYEEDGNVYTAKESVFAIEVKRGMLNKVDLVLPESLSLLYSADSYANDRVKRIYEEFPDRIPTMTDRDKLSLRDQMKDVPRDSKGRWI